MTADRYKYFRIEAREIVDGLGKGLLDLEKHGDAEIVGKLLRLAHTLKGAARIVKHRELADLSHAIEDALAPLRDAPVAQRHDQALALVDKMSALVAALPSAEAQAEALHTPTPVVAPPPAEPMSLPRIDATGIDDVLGGLGEVHALLSRLRALNDPRELERGLERLDREVRDVRYAVEQLRLLPASAMFTALQRTARDAAVAAGKQVELRCFGGEVRLDGQTLGALQAPLVQLVRNAVMHGIEAQRTGKPAVGVIAIEVRLQGGLAIVSCRDDGAGIDYDSVRRAAIKRGLPHDRAAALDDTQLVELLLRGGITTANELTELSGRGIGLDVVRAAAVELGGTITAHSVRGTGTTITISVPASLAAIAALIVEAGGRSAAIPLAAIRRVSKVSHVTRTPAHLSVAFDDLAIPFASLGAVLGGMHDDHSTFVVVEHGGELAGLGVERTRGVEEVVMRGAPRGVPLDPIVHGIALDAEGLPRPVLEPGAVIAAIRKAPVRGEETIQRALPILVVDDSLTTRMLEQSILESAGYEVEIATSGEEALERIAATTYGLMLVDVEMPGMDGFTVISTLRSKPELAGLPAILVTSRNAPEDRQRGIDVGANGYVVKSEFDQVELLALIRKLVRR